LKVLNLSNSIYLTKSPDFSQVPQLEILILEGCTSLVKVHESIGYLKRLVLLNLERCKNLENLPSSISNLKILKLLLVLLLSQLGSGFKLEKLPTSNWGEMLYALGSLTTLKVENTAIKQLPSSFSLLENLETLIITWMLGNVLKLENTANSPSFGLLEFFTLLGNVLSPEFSKERC
jgi:hypothetical protein